MGRHKKEVRLNKVISFKVTEEQFNFIKSFSKEDKDIFNLKLKQFTERYIGLLLSQNKISVDQNNDKEISVDQNKISVDQNNDKEILVDQNKILVDQNNDKEILVDQNKILVDQNKILVDQNKILVDQNKISVDQNKISVDQNKISVDQNNVSEITVNQNTNNQLTDEEINDLIEDAQLPVHKAIKRRAPRPKQLSEYEQAKAIHDAIEAAKYNGVNSLFGGGCE